MASAQAVSASQQGINIGSPSSSPAPRTALHLSSFMAATSTQATSNFPSIDLRSGLMPDSDSPYVMVAPSGSPARSTRLVARNRSFARERRKLL